MMTDITNKKEYEQIAFEELTQLRADLKAKYAEQTCLLAEIETLVNNVKARDEKYLVLMGLKDYAIESNRVNCERAEQSEASLSDYKGMLADTEDAVADLRIVNDKAEATINEFWEALQNSYEIESREELEEDSKNWNPQNSLVVALHYIWKSDANVVKLTARLAVAVEALENIEVVTICARTLNIAEQTLKQIEDMKCQKVMKIKI